jgi:hypothetical protein
LELEVKLLKAAFKMHTSTTAVQSRQQPSIFANACKNSDLFALSAQCSPVPTPAVSEQEQQVKRERQSMDIVASHWWKRPELHASTHGKIEDAAATIGNSDGVSKARARACEVDDLIDSLRSKHQTPSTSGYTSRKRDISDPAAQEMPRFRWHSATHNASDELSKASTSATERGPGEVAQFDMPATRVQEPLAENSDSRLSMDGFSTISSLPRQRGDTKLHIPSPHATTSEQETLKSLLDLEPEAEIARFPTIFQLEKEGRHSTSGTSTTSQDSIRSDAPLTRAKTVTCSNPAARLLKPFDPAAEVLGVSTSQNSLPRRSGTERYRRRPYGEQFSGVGRTLWEEFERPGPQAPVTAPRNLDRPELHIVPPQPNPTITAPRKFNSPELNIVPPKPNPSIARSQSLNYHRPSDSAQPRRLTPMRSALDLSRSQHDLEETITLDQLRNDTASVSTHNPVRRSATDPSQQHLKHIESCIRTLRDMGYKPHSRLPIYAEACNGMLTKAMEMAEEDEKATQETRKIAEAAAKVSTCVQQLQEMGYSAQHADEELKQFARNAEGDVAAAVEALELPDRREMEEWRDGVRELQHGRQRWMQRQPVHEGGGEGEGMPGSFP